jgi:phosphoadenosine phosphosulfate reductase
MNTTQAATEFGTLVNSSKELLRTALGQHAVGEIAISFSGAEDVVLIDLVSKLGMSCEVFSLDTGRLHPETYQFIETVRNHYSLPIDLVMPEPDQVNTLVQQKGLFSFRKDGHSECCKARKIDPLRRKLAQFNAWITGQRMDQSVTRADLPSQQIDEVFAGANGTLEKYNPLSTWRSADVWRYIRSNEVPFNPLHERGFVSIGCEPCTRPIAPHEHERAGRWWWEAETQKECGLHSQNLIAHG